MVSKINYYCNGVVCVFSPSLLIFLLELMQGFSVPLMEQFRLTGKELWVGREAADSQKEFKQAAAVVHCSQVLQLQSTVAKFQSAAAAIACKKPSMVKVHIVMRKHKFNSLLPNSSEELQPGSRQKYLSYIDNHSVVHVFSLHSTNLYKISHF